MGIAFSVKKAYRGILLVAAGQIVEKEEEKKDASFILRIYTLVGLNAVTGSLRFRNTAVLSQMFQGKVIVWHE